MPIRGYDQWKTASPYEDEPNPFKEAERWLREVDNNTLSDHEKIEWAKAIIDAILAEVA